jgi:hypothetical protein
VAHPEETFSLMALGGAVGSIAFFWLDPTFEPESQSAANADDEAVTDEIDGKAQ